jgi:hypothetical protein
MGILISPLAALPYGIFFMHDIKYYTTILNHFRKEELLHGLSQFEQKILLETATRLNAVRNASNHT